MSSTRAVRGNEATLYNDGGRCTLGFVTSDNSFPHCEDHIRPRRPESFSTAGFSLNAPEACSGFDAKSKSLTG